MMAPHFRNLSPVGQYYQYKETRFILYFLQRWFQFSIKPEKSVGDFLVRDLQEHNPPALCKQQHYSQIC